MNKKILFSVVIVLAVVIAGYFLLNKKTDTTNPPRPAYTLNDVPGSSDKIYHNNTYNFQLQVPPSMQNVSDSNNSALSTAQIPVPGIKLGSVILVVANNTDLKNIAENYYSNSAQSANCSQKHVNNSSYDVNYVYCTGGGGPAYYALAKGSGNEIFFDGYTGGAGRALDKTQFENILASLK